MLIPFIPLPEKSQRECSLSKQLIQGLDYSIPLMPHSHLKLSCVRVPGSHDFSKQLFFWHCLSS